MHKMLKFVLIGVSAMTGCTIGPMISNAQDLQLRIGPGGVGVYDPDRDDYVRRGLRGGCDPADALDAARAED